MAMVAVSCLVVFLLALSHVRQDGKAARASRSVQPALSAGASFPLYYIDTQAAYKYADNILAAAAAPPPHHHHHKRLHSQRALVTGHVYCDTCRNGQLKEPLKGVTIGVICWNGEVEKSFYGISNKLGNFKIKLSGYDVHRGVKSCRAKLIYSSFNSPCTLPTNLHDGRLGAKLHVKSKTTEKLVLSVGPFAYTTASKSKKCHHKDTRSMSSHRYKHTSASQSHTHSTQVQAKNIKSPSCPVYDCAKTVSTLSYNLDSELLNPQYRKPMSHHVKYKALSPMSRSFEHLSPPIFRRNKEPNPHKNSLIWF